MKKIAKIENLDCGNCAIALEKLINKIDGVTSCSINFISQKLVVEFDDDKYEEIKAKIIATAKKFEKEIEIRGL